MKKVFVGRLIPLCFFVTFTVIGQTKAVETAGDVLLFGLPTLALGTTLVLGDHEGAVRFGKGFALNQAVTFGLKLVINEPRPNGENNNAFPSGHTSTTFQSAAFIQRRYGWEYGIPAYALAGFTGYSRINADKHDILDVLAGALIGTGSTYLFTTPREKPNIQLTLTSGNEGFLLGFNYQF
nr:phosphatase PAP2 family protein [Allomuricauda sp.]